MNFRVFRPRLQGVLVAGGVERHIVREPRPDGVGEGDDVEVLEDGLVAGRLRLGGAGGNRYRCR